MSLNLLPEIKIKYGWHLAPTFKKVFELDEKNKSKSYPSEETVLVKIKEYKQNWLKTEQKILTEICKILGLRFNQNIIDVYVVGPSPSFSDPMLISGELHADIFVDVLTHELIHRILTQNNKKIDVEKIWNKMFPKRDLITRNHILVHAVHKHIYLDTLKEPARMKRDIEKCAQKPAYKESWDFVNEKGNLKIINEFKEYY